MSERKRLDVRLEPQQTGMWCWAATGQMIMNYLGNPAVTQCGEACDYFHRTDCCNGPVPQGCVNGGWPQFSHYGFDSDCTSGVALSWDQLRSEIDQNRPIAFSWRWTKGGGHMMVVVGYEEDAGQRLVYINDPWPPQIGDAHAIPYEAFVSGNGYVHWNDYFNIKPTGGGLRQWAIGGMTMPDTRGLDATARPIAQDAVGTALRVVGMDAPGAVETVSLGDPLAVIMLGPDQLLQDGPGSCAGPIFASDRTSVIYPIYLIDSVVSAVTLEEQEGQWKPTRFGHSVVAGLAAAARSKHSSDTGTPLDAYFMVDALPLGFQGLAAGAAAGLVIIPIMDDPTAGFRAGVPLQPEQVLTVLTERARRLNAAPA